MNLHPSDRSDAELVSLCIEGDGRAWEVLVRRYRRLVWSIALTRGLKEDEAEDAFQETWIRVHGALGTLRQVESLTGWIASVARSQVSRVHRGRKRDRKAAEEMEGRARIAAAGDSADEAERFQEVSAAVDRMAGRCRDLLRMLYGEEASYDAVMKRMRMARGSIGPTRARCLEKLKGLVEEGRS